MSHNYRKEIPTFDLLPSEISPTLAEFFNVPFATKMSEEDIVLALWKYIESNNLLIDGRLILLDALLKPVIHPFFIWEGNDCNTEQSIVMVFIAKMHLDPDFIREDVLFRLDRIKRNIAARKILYFLKSRSGDERKEISTEDIKLDVSWVSHLASIYGSNP